MCGRFTLTAPGDALAAAFDLDETPFLAKRWNIAPTQAAAALRRARPRVVELLRWGLGERRLINARVETAGARPAFRDALSARRCLVLADGFYEWQRVGDAKQPHFVRRRDGAPFAIAALWESPPDAPMPSCVLLTTTANEVLRPVHDRMPVIVDPRDYHALLDSATPRARAADALRPLAPGALVAWPVSTHVNAARNDDPGCISPLR